MLAAVCADDIYAFTDATKVTLDGKEPTGRISSDTLGMPPMYWNRIIVLEKYYNFDEDVTVLNRSDINIDQPEIGITQADPAKGRGHFSASFPTPTMRHSQKRLENKK